jgi:hypothetical protein
MGGKGSACNNTLTAWGGIDDHVDAKVDRTTSLATLSVDVVVVVIVEAGEEAQHDRKRS